MGTVIRFACIVAAAASLAGCATFLPGIFGYTYPLPGKDLEAEAICGKKKCVPGTSGTPFHYTQHVHAPAVTSTTTVHDVAMQLVGYTVKSNSLVGDLPFTCSSTGESPFVPAEVVALGMPNGMRVDYEIAEELEINIGAAVDADIKAMEAAGVFGTATLPVEEARAKLMAAYQALDSSRATMSARYFDFGLSPQAYRSVFETGAKADCAAIIRSGSRRLITAVGIVWFDLEIESQSASKLITDLQAEFRTSGIEFDLGASVRREVNKSMKLNVEGGFAVISERRAGLSSF